VIIFSSQVDKSKQGLAKLNGAREMLAETEEVYKKNIDGADNDHI